MDELFSSAVIGQPPSGKIKEEEMGAPALPACAQQTGLLEPCRKGKKSFRRACFTVCLSISLKVTLTAGNRNFSDTHYVRSLLIIRVTRRLHFLS
jgi:hypothetical protein